MSVIRAFIAIALPRPIQQKLDEFGVFDKQLDVQINRTEQTLKILNREKELRTEGYNWSAIKQTIQNETK